jgi:protease I
MILGKLLLGFKVAILLASGVEQTEVVGPQQALEEAGAIVHIVAPEKDKVQGWDCYALRPKDEIMVDMPLSMAQASDYNALVIPGGLCNDDMRIDESALTFVKGFANKPIASICHGQCILINADLVKNKTLTSYPSIKIDLVNAGAAWIDQEVVRDGYLLTSRNRDDVPAFSAALVALFAEYAAQKSNELVPISN